MNYYDEAKKRLDSEIKKVSGNKESAMKNEVRKAVLEFCRQNDEFAQAVAECPKNFGECMKTVAKGVGSSISDLEAYKKAVQFYFAGADVEFSMTIKLANTENNKSEESSESKSALTISLDDLLS